MLRLFVRGLAKAGRPPTKLKAAFEAAAVAANETPAGASVPVPTSIAYSTTGPKGAVGAPAAATTLTPGEAGVGEIKVSRGGRKPKDQNEDANSAAATTITTGEAGVGEIKKVSRRGRKPKDQIETSISKAAEDIASDGGEVSINSGDKLEDIEMRQTAPEEVQNTEAREASTSKIRKRRGRKRGVDVRFSGETENVQLETTAADAPLKRKRGRPKGSKNLKSPVQDRDSRHASRESASVKVNRRPRVYLDKSKPDPSADPEESAEWLKGLTPDEVFLKVFARFDKSSRETAQSVTDTSAQDQAFSAERQEAEQSAGVDAAGADVKKEESSASSSGETKSKKPRRKSEYDEDGFPLEMQLRLERSISKKLKADVKKYLDHCGAFEIEIRDLKKQIEFMKSQTAVVLGKESDLASAEQRIRELENLLEKERKESLQNLLATEALLRSTEQEAGTLRDHISSETLVFQKEVQNLERRLAESEERAGRLLADLANDRNAADTSKAEIQKQIDDSIRAIDELELKFKADEVSAMEKIDAIEAAHSREREMLAKRISELEEELRVKSEDNSRLIAEKADADSANSEAKETENLESLQPRDGRFDPAYVANGVSTGLVARKDNSLRVIGQPNVMYARFPTPICSLRMSRRLIEPSTMTMVKFRARALKNPIAGPSPIYSDPLNRKKGVSTLRDDKTSEMEAIRELLSQIEVEKRSLADQIEKLSKEKEDAEQKLAEVASRFQNEKRHVEQQLLTATSSFADLESKCGALEGELSQHRRTSAEQLEKVQASQQAAERRASELQTQLDALKKKNEGFSLFRF